MKNVAIFRIFLAFPLIGIALPDAASKFEDANYYIPASHLILFVTLVTVLLGSLAIKRANNTDEANLAN